MKKHNGIRKDKNIKVTPAVENSRRVVPLHKNSRQRNAAGCFEAVPALTARRLHCMILHHFQELMESGDS